MAVRVPANPMRRLANRQLSLRQLSSSTTRPLAFSPRIFTARHPTQTSPSTHRRPAPARLLSSSRRLHDQDQKQPPPNNTASDQQPPTFSPPSTLYTYEDLVSFSTKPSPHRILIDVREPAELASTGTIPTALNVPVSSAPDAFFLGADEFEDRFGFARPAAQDEVVFFCKAGVRSKAAARLAQQAGFGGKVGEYPGSWAEWSERGGEVERAPVE